MEKQHVKHFEECCELMRRGAYIRYGIGPQMLLCYDSPSHPMVLPSVESPKVGAVE